MCSPNKSADDWIRDLGLVPHPANCTGFIKEVFKSSISVKNGFISDGSDNERVGSTGIYFLMKQGQMNRLHALKSDETYAYHAGNPLTIYHLEKPDRLVRQVLGPDPSQGHFLQAVVPAGHFMAGIIEEEENATSHAAFVLFSVVVSPGFDIRDDVAGNREELVKQFPKHKDFVERFTRGQR